MTADTPVRVGIAGLGRSGWNIHAALLAELPGKFRIQAVADPDPHRCREAADRFGCRVADGYDDLLRNDQVELVIVALPTSLHTEASIAALEAGKAVVCEKPMAVSLADTDRMIAEATRTGQLLTVFQNRRYVPDFLKVREVLSSGVLGRIVLIRIVSSGFGRRWDWQTLKHCGGGTLNNNGVHFLDQAMLLLGETEPKVLCHMERTLTLGDAEDHVKVILQGQGAPMVEVELSSACAYPTDVWQIMGTQGGLTGTTSHLRWKTIDPSTLPERTVDERPTPDRSYNHEELAWHEETCDVADYHGPGQAGYYLDLYRTLREGAPLVVTPQSVRRVMAVIEECHRLSPVWSLAGA